LKNANGDPIVDDSCKANALNKFFASVGRTLAKDLNVEELTCLNTHIYRVTPTLSKIELNFDAFSRAFSSTVKPGKSAGIDEITARDLMLNEKASKEGLFRVVSSSIKSGTFPTKWKTAKGSCIFKKGSPKKCSNYRLISLLCIPARLLSGSYVLSFKTTFITSTCKVKINRVSKLKDLQKTYCCI